jgi:beta-1,4-N-acetylglucosaminyltransferase
MLAFLTVGSTRFDALVQSVLSSPVLSSLRAKGYTRLTVQCGDSNFELASSIPNSRNYLEKDGVSIELWKFKPSLQEEYERADLVIGHAGMPCTKCHQVVAEDIQDLGLFSTYSDLRNQ